MSTYDKGDTSHRATGNGIASRLSFFTEEVEFTDGNVDQIAGVQSPNITLEDKATGPHMEGEEWVLPEKHNFGQLLTRYCLEVRKGSKPENSIQLGPQGQICEVVRLRFEQS